MKQDARVVKHPHFESGVIKVQNGQESQLTKEEKVALEPFLLHYQGEVEDLTEDGDEKIDNYAIQASRKIKRRRMADSLASMYQDLSFVIAVTNDCERLFSKVGRTYSPLRGKLEIVSLESQLLVLSNWCLTCSNNSMKTNPKQNKVGRAF